MNRLQLLGYLGSDPEQHIFDGGAKVTNLRIATTERSFATADGRVIPERTTWHNVRLWGALGDAASKMLQKGSRVYLEGTLHTSEIEKDGQKAVFYYVDATHCDFLSNLKPKAMPETPPPPALQ